jgi:5-methylcytosine-specific restriction endonuclease McrA
MSKLVKCMVCGKEYNSLKCLSSHIRVHNITSYEYYEKFLKKDADGICINYGKVDCCKKETKWINMVVGYHRFCSENCMVKSEEVRRKFKEAVSGDKHWLKQPGAVHPNKDKHYEEIHGEKKAKELKEHLSILGKKLIGDKNPFFNHHHTEETLEILRNVKLDKTYDELYGTERSKEIRLKQSGPQKKPWPDKNNQTYTSKFHNKSFREEILNDQENLCAICRTFLYPKRKHFHHINFIKSDDRRENIVCLCPSCHGKTKNRLTYENTMEFLINRNKIIIIESRERLKLNKNKK